MKFNLSSTDKRYLAALVVLTGVILFWRGLWDTIYLIPLVENPFVSLFLGLLIMTLSGVIFKEFDPLAAEFAKVIDIINKDILKSKKRGKVRISYYDEAAKKMKTLKNKSIKKMEHNVIVIDDKGKESFIPVHRIHHISKGGKTVWKKEITKKTR